MINGLTQISGRGRRLSLTPSFGETAWFDVPGEIQGCDWSEPRFFVRAQYEFVGYGFNKANHSAVYPPVHQITEFRQTTV